MRPALSVLAVYASGSSLNTGFVLQVDFFQGIPLERSSIALTLTPEGRPQGEAYVEFPTEEAQKEALGRHKDAMGERYIELFLSTKANMIQVKRLIKQYAHLPIRRLMSRGVVI